MNKDYMWGMLELAEQARVIFYDGRGGVDTGRKLDLGFPEHANVEGWTYYDLGTSWHKDKIIQCLSLLANPECINQAQPGDSVNLYTKIPMIQGWGEIRIWWMWSEYECNYSAAHIPFLPTDDCTDLSLTLVDGGISDKLSIPFDNNALRQIADNADSIGVFDDLGQCLVTKKIKGSAFDPSQLADVSTILSSHLGLPAETLVDTADSATYNLACKWGSRDSINQALCNWVKKIYFS